MFERLLTCNLINSLILPSEFLKLNCRENKHFHLYLISLAQNNSPISNKITVHTIEFSNILLIALVIIIVLVRPRLSIAIALPGKI